MAPHTPTTTTASTAAPSTDAPAPRVLVVFDYDESLVEDDSEVYFGKTVCPHLLGELFETIYAKGGVNSSLADAAQGMFHERMPHVTREQMRDAIARVPVSPAMLAAVKLTVDQYNATVVIASDSNEFYIQSMLDHTGLAAYVAEVHANKARWQDEDESSNRLRVEPYHSTSEEPHGCALCPSNLCKGRIIDALRKKTEYDVVLYVGDGRGDYCPSTRLTSRDVVFARADTASGRSFGLLKKINEEPHKVAARVVPWHTGDDIHEQFQKALEAAAVA